MGHRRLLIRPGAIGDFVVSLPALEALKADWTEVWCAGQNVPLVRFADRARSISQVGLDRLGFQPAEELIEDLRGFDSIISWYGANNPDFQHLTRVELKLNVEFPMALPGAGEHAGAYYRRQALGLGAKRVADCPRIPCPVRLRSFAAVHPFASGQRKRAPMEVFRKAADTLAGRMPVHWLRGPEDELEGAVHIPNLYDLACWLAGARIYVGNDSGIAHLAAAVGTPVVALFPANSPREWMPRGPAVSAVVPG